MLHTSEGETMTKASGIAVHCAHDELMDVASLIPNPRNPNKHGDKQVAMLAKIIRHQGWRAPVVVSRRPQPIAHSDRMRPTHRTQSVTERLPKASC